MNGRRRAELLALIVLSGFTVAVGLHYVLAFYEGRPYPYSTFLFTPADRFTPEAPGLGAHIFGDFYGTWQHTKDASPYLAPGVFYPSNYLPGTHLLLKPLAWLDYPIAAGVFLVGSATGVVVLFWRQVTIYDRLSKALIVIVLGLLTYPVLFALDRGNVDLLVFFGLWAMLASICKGRWIAAALALSVAASMKGFPAIFVILLIQARQWRALAVTVATSAGLSLIALAIMAGGIVDNLLALKSVLIGFDEASTQGTRGLQHVSTIAGLLGVLQHYFPSMEGIAAASTAIGAALLLLVIGASLLLQLERWETVILLTVATIVVPTVSYDYRLTLVLLPVLLVLNVTEAPDPPLSVIIVLGLLLVPKGLPVLWADVGLGTLVNPLLLLSLVGIVLARALRRPLSNPVHKGSNPALT